MKTKKPKDPRYRFFKDSLGWGFRITYAGNTLTIGEFKTYEECLKHYKTYYLED